MSCECLWEPEIWTQGCGKSPHGWRIGFSFCMLLPSPVFFLFCFVFSWDSFLLLDDSSFPYGLWWEISPTQVCLVLLKTASSFNYHGYLHLCTLSGSTAECKPAESREKILISTSIKKSLSWFLYPRSEFPIDFFLSVHPDELFWALCRPILIANAPERVCTISQRFWPTTNNRVISKHINHPSSFVQRTVQVAGGSYVLLIKQCSLNTKNTIIHFSL